MLKFKLLLLLCVTLSCSLFAQEDSLNMEQLYNYDDNTFSPVSGVYFNDCWGFTDTLGNEYAILGGARNVYFFDITDPVNTTLIRKVFDGDPDIAGNVDLDPTIWRDFKTYKKKAYSVADQFSSNEGLIVYDLSQLPDTVLVEAQYTDFFTKSHNIFIDTARGYLYTAGARVGSVHHHVIVLDLNTDPIELVADVSIDGGKLHDIHVVNDTAYCNSETSELYIIDFTDPENPSTIGSMDSYTGSGYNHSGWLTEDGDHYVFCDETQGRKVKIMDVSDPVNISNASITDQFFSNLVNPSATNPGSLAHNPFIIGDLVYVAYYDDGVQIFNIADPSNVVREAYYDTNVNTGYGNDGVWGVYPFFASGSIIASDMVNGLFVLQQIDGTLPVELLNFNVIQSGKKVRLDWSTASERNSEAFEIQRSTDGEDFYTIKTVAASNNSTTRIDYETYDDNPLDGINYYRLKQVDLDGAFQLSEIKSVQMRSGAVSLAPTLVKNEQAVQLHFDKIYNDVTVEVMSINGQVAKTYVFQNDGEGQYEIPTNDLLNGIYVFRVKYNQTTFVEKVMIAR